MDDTDDQQCLKIGAKRRTDMYVACRLQLRREHENAALMITARQAATEQLDRENQHAGEMARARQDTANDALIAAGLGLMAQPARAAAPLSIDCSVTPGSLGRSINCW